MLQMEYFEFRRKRRMIFDPDNTQFEPIYPEVDPDLFPNPNSESGLEDECSNNWNLCLYVKVQLIYYFKLLLLLLLLHFYPPVTHRTASDANCWTISTLFIAIRVFGEICTCLGISNNPMFMWISLNSCPLI